MKSWNKFIQCDKRFYSPAMDSLLNHIEEAICHAEHVLKSDPTSTVVALKIDDHHLVVKRANTKSALHAVRRLFLPSRAQKNWHNTQKLLALGVNTFTPIALVEEKWGLLKGRSYFVCTYIEGTSALSFFQDKTQKAFWGKAIENLVQLSLKLAKNWVSHRDLNLSNIIFRDQEPWLIDLDAMSEHAFCWFAKRAARREQQRFLQNCRETPGVSTEINDLLQVAFSQNMVNFSLSST